MALAQGIEAFVQHSHESPAPEEDVRDWRSWESWVTLTLILLVQLPVVGSLQSSNWVSEMPSLMAPAAIGLAAAWMLSHTRLPGGLSALAGVAVGVVAVVGLVMHTMELVDPTATGLLDRWAEFRLRVLEWSRALLDGGISADPLPFVVLLVATVYGVGFISTWSVVRWRNPWLALIPGGIVLLTNISFLPGQPSFSFILFLLAAILLVTRLTFLRSLSHWRRRGMHAQEGMSVEVLVVGALAGAVLVFAAWMIPTANHWGPVADVWGRAFAPVQERVDRLGQLFVGVGSKKPIPVHAMGGVLPFQGAVNLDRDVLFQVIAPEEMNIRGAVYNEYTGAGWRLSSAAAVPVQGSQIEEAEVGTTASVAAIRETVRLDVTVLHDSAPSGVLLSAGDPLAADLDSDLVVDRTGNGLQMRVDAAVQTEETYSTVGTRSIASAETLGAAGQEYPADIVAGYLPLPASMPRDVQDLTLQVVAGAANPYEAARLVENYLRQNYTFSLDVDAPPPGRDAVAHFLFESQTGYFDLFASSMATMLRSVGIPTRVAVGFALDDADLDPATKAYSVTEESAWSWPEVYFPRLGWVEFNPSPTRAILARPGDDSAARAAAGGLSGLEDEFLDDFLFEELDEPSTIAVDLAAAGGADGGFGALLARIVGWTLIGATFVLLSVLGVRFWWERMFRRLDPASKRWAKVQWWAAAAGLQTEDDLTPGEAAAALGRRLGEPGALANLGRSYTRARYAGPRAAAETAGESAALDRDYQSVRRVLVRLAIRRVTRLGNVPGGALARRDAALRASR